MQTKYVFVTGGVTSSLGKGIICASLGRLLENRGLRVTIQKFDPYINVDPGTMNPYEHGEVYVTDDGAETDLDLGHYERFLGVPTSQANNVTTGRVYLEVINKERSGAYLGRTVQVVPHIIDEIKHWMQKLGETGDYDVVLTEIGGTVGDIEGQPYLEAIRQLRYELGYRNTLNIHLTLVPFLEAAGELKSKPTQHSVKTLLSFGLQPDILVCRMDRPLSDDVKRKLALFCNVDQRAVVASLDAESIYEVPLLMREQGLDTIAVERLHMKEDFEGRVLDSPDMDGWVRFLRQLKEPEGTVRIALVGKYVEHQDAYKSICESFIMAGAANGVEVDLRQILSDDITKENVAELLEDVSGVLVAPGFGDRGIEGKIEAVRHVRENDIPFFGICLGMQTSVIEYARNVCGWKSANSTEFDSDTEFPVIDLMEEQKKISEKGGTMRLGAYTCELAEGSKVGDIYGRKVVKERHRHRYELNNVLRYKLAENGMQFTGVNPKRDLVEIVELPDLRWFVGVQFHPEYKSTVGNPHPLFNSFVRACVEHATDTDRMQKPTGPKRNKKRHLASAKM
ncbi:MAG: CTP synthase [Bacteroidetes Order II. Incertae sedis bacterium]|nr:CTP synthase [Bacteroidetes Order II. bacterium]MDG1754235.1 CTP synthase [Rhodothermales bacterium]HAY36437.1 CTP synthase [Bacteroidota bacterium]MBT4052817.1 CTP synthase [Bacteroidetes Order II. bacterium]MBT4603269.1 CTP synthase [Bacteroidetes Order II. bacterium]